MTAHLKTITATGGPASNSGRSDPHVAGARHGFAPGAATDQALVIVPGARGGLARSERFRDRNPAVHSVSVSEHRSALTLREHELLTHLGKGLLYKEIADRMGISFSKVHKLQHKIFLKLRVSNRTEAVNRWKSGGSQ
jgi:DNA-binding NarL/FixJ family response regulator